MSEELTRFQIQLLLYFLEAEPKKRTFTDAARYFGKTKVSVTRTLDSLEKLGIENTRQKNSAFTLWNKACSRIPTTISNCRKIHAIFRPNPITGEK